MQKNKIKKIVMKANAISLANYFVGRAVAEQVDVLQLSLMKRVYIAHGFCLAIFDRSALDPRFDVVEAWKYGPVIPSVYHSFKHNRKNPIIEESVIINVDPKTYGIDWETPKLTDIDIIKVADVIWNRYLDFSDSQLVELTHRQGTPWGMCYQPGKTCIIPDEYTKAFYKKLIKR